MKLKPFPVQKRNIEAMVNSIKEHGLVLNASSVGVGKTLCAIETCRKLGRIPFIICPVAVIPSWERSLDAQGVDYYGIYSWESLIKGRRPNIYDGRSWRIPMNAILIFDEVHKGKNHKAKSGKMVINAMKREDLGKIFLSATPFNSPADMGVMGYCLGLFTSPARFYNWALANGCSMNPWNSLTFNHKKQGIITNINNFLKETGKLVKITRDDMAKFFTETDIQPMVVDFGDTTRQLLNKVERTLRYSGSIDVAVMATIMGERREAELGKVKYLSELICKTVEEGSSAVVFLNFTESIEQLSARLDQLNIGHGIISGQVKRDRKSVV